jgi:hypothetical protein
MHITVNNDFIFQDGANVSFLVIQDGSDFVPKVLDIIGNLGTLISLHR